MKRTLVASLLLAASVAFAQDQSLTPVLVDQGGVMIKPNPTAFCASNLILRTDSAFYSVYTNSALLAAVTGTAVSVASLNVAITNIPASSIVSGNIALARMTNAMNTTIALAAAALPANSVSFTSSWVNVEAGTTSRLVVINGRVTAFSIP